MKKKQQCDFVCICFDRRLNDDDLKLLASEQVKSKAEEETKTKTKTTSILANGAAHKSSVSCA